MAKEKRIDAPKGNVENSGQEKLSYEQLEQIAGNLNQQCRQMQEHIRNLQNAIAEFNEIGMLLDVLEKKYKKSQEKITNLCSVCNNEDTCPVLRGECPASVRPNAKADVGEGLMSPTFPL